LAQATPCGEGTVSCRPMPTLPQLQLPQQPQQPLQQPASSSSSVPSKCSAIPSGRGYSRVREIGQGSYGKAIVVEDSERKLYVMKVGDMSAMNRKQRHDAINEVRVLSSLKHPYVVSYHESFMEKGHLVIIMDDASGGDLFQRIGQTQKADHSFHEAQIIRWFTEVVLALKYMHNKHVLHRDLKSQNIFLTSADRMRLGDFGVSKILENTEAFARTALGSLYYLSPEICQEKPYSFGSDIWALGCILYEMAALRVPFDAPNLRALVQKITHGPMPMVPSAYSQELRQLCGDLLHRDMKQRPTATELIQRRCMQEEIRRMLAEERAKASSGSHAIAAVDSKAHHFNCQQRQPCGATGFGRQLRNGRPSCSSPGHQPPQGPSPRTSTSGPAQSGLHVAAKALAMALHA